jgi:Uri superfamily endonuclease
MNGEFQIRVVGKMWQGGAYVLRIRLGRDVHLCFGRFRQGKTIGLKAGEYAYVGSALAEKGATSLACRLLRHATRSAGKRPHAIRDELLNRFRAVGLGSEGLKAPEVKRLRWNVDYLLDLKAAEIVGAVVARSRERLEEALADRLEQDAHAQVIEKGLGAADAAGQTHLLRVEAGMTWWAELVEWIESRL